MRRMTLSPLHAALDILPGFQQDVFVILIFHGHQVLERHVVAVLILQIDQKFILAVRKVCIRHALTPFPSAVRATVKGSRRRRPCPHAPCVPRAARCLRAARVRRRRTSAVRPNTKTRRPASASTSPNALVFSACDPAEPSMLRGRPSSTRRSRTARTAPSYTGSPGRSPRAHTSPAAARWCASDRSYGNADALVPHIQSEDAFAHASSPLRYTRTSSSTISSRSSRVIMLRAELWLVM